MEKRTYIPKKKSLGQHFLTNPRIAARIAEAAALTKNDTVLEVGPGGGILTRELLLRSSRVIAVEKDRRLIDTLAETFKQEIAEKKLLLLYGDALLVDLSSLPLPRGYQVIANIPYYITGALIRKLLTTNNQPQKIILLVQKEVAERIVRSKKESLLSLSVKVYGTPKIIGRVRAGSFNPPPRVDSAILSIEHISRKKLGTVLEKCFFELVRQGFAHKRKLLMGNLGALASREELEVAFRNADIPKNARAEDVLLQKWLMLAKNLKS